ncbi:MAG: ethylbenzene dehydrogenase-related protein [Dehalococcoidia bacterium]|nr:ethylbenzene dehydrogenase-related protein [Dehalococcoidia bacterium]
MPAVSHRAAAIGLVAAVLAAAAVLTQLDSRLVSSQALSLQAGEAQEKVPLDNPLAGVWEGAAPLEIPLSAQQLTAPMGGGSIRAVTVRAVHDARRIYFRLEWDDATQDLRAFAPEEFRDAAAIEFPANGVSTLPSFCMGQAGAKVNIWHWKADWQADIDSGFVNVPQAYPNAAADFYPFQDSDTFYPGRAAGNLLSRTEHSTPVENIVAGGFGTLTTAEQQTVQGKGLWQDGRWYVLFARELEGGGDYTPFEPGQTTNVAFAVWDGSQNERDGLKSVSQFVELAVAGGGGGAGTETFVVLGVIAAIIIGGLGFLLYSERFKRKA